jgi:AhpD family alkylhydroperoxidase
MTNTWKDSLDTGLERIGSLGETAPGTLAGYRQLHAAGAQSGQLGAKVRELICIAVAVTTRSEVCILNHVAKAKELGATREEVAEALGVAVAMNAGAAIVYSSQALDAYGEMKVQPGIAATVGVCG